MNPDLVLKIMKMILCHEDVHQALKSLAEQSSTQLDDIAVDIIYTILNCEG